MTPHGTSRRVRTWILGLAFLLIPAANLPAQQWVTETRDPKQVLDEDFAKAYQDWTGEARYGSPLVDHLPKGGTIPSPKDVLGYHIGAPRRLTYYGDIVRYYRALEKTTSRVKVEAIGKSDEGRELVVVWVSSDKNMAALQQNRDNLAKLADPRGIPDVEIKRLIATTKPQYHLMGGLHSSETGPSEMLMELVYRLATETSPFITQIRDNVYVSVTPVADADGRDRNVDQFNCTLELQERLGNAGAPGAGNQCALPYWGKYVYHDNNRDINLSQVSMRAIVEWYYKAHPPIMHDLHEAQPLMYTYSGGPPQNPNLDPILFGELPLFANWEMTQMTSWGMPGVYTHAFMDGWSPGYLGSVAYNHNGMMRMYETQSGRDTPAPPPTQVTPGATGGNGARGGNRAGGGGAGAGTAAAATGAAGSAGATQAPPPGGRGAGGATGAPAPGFGRGGNVPTGRGGGQDREWYRGIPIPPGAAQSFSRRNNTNYMQTGVLLGLQLTSMMPNKVIENFYLKTRNSIQQGLTQAPYGYVIPAQRDMTKPAELVRILRLQGIEVGQTTAEAKVGDHTFGPGSYVIKGGQPYFRLAKNLLEKQNYPDARLNTYDDSGWTMGYAFNVDVNEIRDKGVLDIQAPLIKAPELKGKVSGTATAGLAVAHYGSNNMISFRYRLKDVPMKIAEKSFTAGTTEFPAGSFIIGALTPDVRAAVGAAVEQFGLTATTLDAIPPVATHDADAPRVAIYTQWSGTQELGWYRDAFDKFGIPYDLIYKERIAKGNLKADYDVILMAAQNLSRTVVMQPPASRPNPYKKSEKYQFLGMYGETDDTTGGFGEKGVAEFQKFFEAGGTLIATVGAVRYPIDFGFAHTVDTEGVAPPAANQPALVAQKPLVQAEIVKTDHPVFYGYLDKNIPIKFAQGQQFFRVGTADQGNVLARFVGGDSAVLSGLMEGGAAIAQKAFAVDIPEAYRGKGRVIMFTNNPVYRWQNHGEFNMVFNSIINWNDVVSATPLTAANGGRR
jgi:hypothetical protein